MSLLAFLSLPVCTLRVGLIQALGAMVSLQAVVKANIWLIGIVAGLAAIVRPMKSIRLGLRSKTWRRAKAIVTSSGLDREGNVYYPNVIYRYLVNGREYIDGTFSFAKGDAATKAYCVDFVQRHPEGKEILIFANPDDASQSVIEPGAHWTAYRNVVLLFGLLAGLGLIWQWTEAS